MIWKWRSDEWFDDRWLNVMVNQWRSNVDLMLNQWRSNEWLDVMTCPETTSREFTFKDLNQVFVSSLMGFDQRFQVSGIPDLIPMCHSRTRWTPKDPNQDFVFELMRFDQRFWVSGIPDSISAHPSRTRWTLQRSESRFCFWVDEIWLKILGQLNHRFNLHTSFQNTMDPEWDHVPASWMRC